MGRFIGSRFELRATLRAVSALHVGTGAEERAVDLAVARDGSGQPHVPGTSLAGALRAWTAPALGAGDESWERLWGPPGDRGAGLWASRLLVEDAPVRLPDDQAVEEVRDGIAIDPRTGGALRRHKYERAVLPVGSLIALTVRCDVEREHEAEARELLQGLRRALRDRRIALGGARSRGLGRVELVPGSDTLTHEPLGGREAILAALERRLRGDGPALDVLPLDATPSSPRSTCLRVRLAWRPVGPLMVRSGREGLAVDSLPLMARVDGGRAPLLPGSSIKGVLRSQAERIMRTVLDVPDAGSSRDLVGWLFGRAPAGRADGDQETVGPETGLSAVWVEDCLAEQLVPGETWERIEGARWISRADRDRELMRSAGAAEAPGEGEREPAARQMLDAAGLHGWDPAVHVAIDRWTGGAAESLLYSVLEPHDVCWRPIELAVDMGRIAEEARGPAVALLLLVLADMGRGVLPLGFATNRGMGTIEVSELTVEVERGAREAPEAAAAFGWLGGTYPVSHERGILDRLGPARFGELARDWSRWLEDGRRPSGGARP